MQNVDLLLLHEHYTLSDLLYVIFSCLLLLLLFFVLCSFHLSNRGSISSGGGRYFFSSPCLCPSVSLLLVSTRREGNKSLKEQVLGRELSFLSFDAIAVKC